MQQQINPVNSQTSNQLNLPNGNEINPIYARPNVTWEGNIWEGNIEWKEKNKTNPNLIVEVTHVVKAQMISNIILDTTSGQYVPEIPPAFAQGWPKKIPLQLLSKQVLDILNKFCTPPTSNCLLVTDENNLELKNCLKSLGVSRLFISKML